ncbi:hypothetical protein CAPTEDRAFT_221453 [Capitella teleta]|uniref:MYND-type domain-containing protein n=1 Tax=Capitella teleta TaxID=283909 RepID=R7U1E8_CAPTE|nr:hypothetical protein CAPTEDRAFT_221453 [Capitella teleta]|eukprot:ELT97476.1 hypothetical protein CAPTEDRAFT_221453 [Capitella teleta]
MTIERTMSGGLDNPFPRLKTAATADVNIDCREYKSGAKYKGQVNDHRKTGHGSFIWPNGSRYEGEFTDNVRHGQGLQQWADGSTYEGDFVQDVRHGIGKHTWANGEGRPVFIFGQGLYVNNERHGPGVVFHPDGTQDVGLWSRERIVKLCADIPKAFTVKDHPEVEHNAEDHRNQISVKAFTENRTDIIQSIVHPPDAFKYEPHADLTSKVNEIFSDRLHARSLAMDIKVFDQEFYRDANCNGSSETLVPTEQHVAVNNTPSAIAMQRQVIRHSQGQGHVSFNVDLLLKGDRECASGPKGLAETASEEFLMAAIAGDLLKIQTALNKGYVHVDVADKNGSTALLGAAVNWHQDVINFLLDSGADINKLNDEGLSALSACHIFYYPPEYFRYNIAEKDLERPPDMEQEPGYDVNEVVKGILGTAASAKKPRGMSRASTLSTIDNQKIVKLRAEYAHKSVIMEDEEMNSDAEPFDDRELGTLKVKRAVRINVDEVLSMNEAEMDAMSPAWEDHSNEVIREEDEETESLAEEFESTRSVRNLSIEVTDQLIERSATGFSTNEMIVSRNRSRESKLENLGTVRRLAMDKSLWVFLWRALMRATIHLLLKRGADPNACTIPMPVLFFAVKAADVEAVRLLLSKGASTSARLSDKKGGLAPLHIACCIPGEEGVKITELLLNSLADPDVRATLDESFLNHTLEDEWSKDVIPEASQKLLGGRAPLHIACARDDNYANACRVVHLLLDHHANPDLLCNGHSPLALAVISGNDLAVDELLAFGADPCLPLTHGVGSALCIASSTEFEQRRTPSNRLLLIDKLIRAGADILAPIPIGPKRIMGTAVDFAYHMYNADRRIAHMPYHALTHAERETFNARRKLLSHMGDILRMKAVEREKMRLEQEEAAGHRSRSPSANFVYTGSGSAVPPGIIKRSSHMTANFIESHVSFGQEEEIRKPLLRYCYECGRSVGVRLSACTRCKEVNYCSKACKLKAWNARHKEECVRIGGRSPSPGKDKRIDSPTPTTDPDKGAALTVKAISKENKLKFPPLHDTAPNIFMAKKNKKSPLRSSFELKRNANSKRNVRSVGKSFGGFDRGFTARMAVQVTK